MDILKKILHSDNENDLEEFLIFIAERLNQKNGDATKVKTFYTSKEICNLYGFSLSTLERRVRDGMPFISAGIKKKRLFRVSDVENFIIRRR